MSSFSNIDIKDIKYFLNYYNIDYGDDIYLTAWNYILQNKNISVPLSINNWILNYNSYQTMRISGPASWYQLEYNGVKYDLFGDKHFSYSGSCDNNDYTIDKLMDYIFKHNISKNILTDVYLETAFITKNYVSSPKLPELGYINDIDTMLGDCLRKKDCHYNTNIIRIHYADVRVIHDNSKLLFLDFHFTKTIKNLIDRNDITSDINDFNDVISFLADNFLTILTTFEKYEDFPSNINTLYEKIPKTKYGNNVRNGLEKNINLTSLRDGKRIHKIAIQLHNIKNITIKKHIITYIHYTTKQMQKELKNLSNELRNNISVEVYKTILNKIKHVLLLLTAIFTDEYLLSRMFRFDDSKYVMIYAGYVHINRYIKFFKFLGVNPNKIYMKDDERCIINYQLN